MLRDATMNTAAELEDVVDEDDNPAGSVNGSEEPASELTLVFTAEGQAVLEEDGEPVWFSDDDDDFQIDHGEEFLDPEEDAARILNWLVKNDWVDEDEKSEVEIEIEDDGGDDSESEDED